MRMVVLVSGFVSLPAVALADSSGLASRGSPIGAVVLALAVGLALRMGKRRQRRT